MTSLGGDPTVSRHTFLKYFPFLQLGHVFICLTAVLYDSCALSGLQFVGRAPSLPPQLQLSRYGRAFVEVLLLCIMSDILLPMSFIVARV